jgi:membrane-associated HD superfamily phosphohydrolase
MNLLTTVAAMITENDYNNLPKAQLNNGSFDSVLKLVFGFAGAISVIIIVIAGLKYVTSQGNPQETAKAKDTIIYAVIGLAVCFLAFFIIGFVVETVA